MTRIPRFVLVTWIRISYTLPLSKIQRAHRILDRSDRNAVGVVKKLTIVSIVLIILVAALWTYDFVSDLKHEIAVLKPITLLEKAPQDYPVSNRESGKILAGEHMMVLRM